MDERGARSDEEDSPAGFSLLQCHLSIVCSNPRRLLPCFDGSGATCVSEEEEEERTARPKCRREWGRPRQLLPGKKRRCCDGTVTACRASTTQPSKKESFRRPPRSAVRVFSFLLRFDTTLRIVQRPSAISSQRPPFPPAPSEFIVSRRVLPEHPHRPRDVESIRHLVGDLRVPVVSLYVLLHLQVDSDARM